MKFASDKQVNLASSELKVNNALNHHWCETSLLPQAILKHVVSRDLIVRTWYMLPVLLVISRLLSRSTGVTNFQPCFPGQDLNTGQCNKLHISQ